ncbi:MAG: chemotaxis protein CheW [Bdellovibrionota bacterium]|tara:strand:+ start:21068 stop:23860 length:2793 start_codon:yes stop_codon:yes gene_type:complete
MGQEKLSPIVQEFILESSENVQIISTRLTSLEKDPENKDMINELYRAVHTIKGGAGFLKLKNLEKLTHNLENVLDLIRADKLPLNGSFIDLALESVDAIQFFVNGVEQTGEEPEGKFDDLVKRLLAMIESDVTQNEMMSPDSHLLDTTQELAKALGESKISDVNIEAPEVLKQVVEPAPAAAPAPAPKASENVVPIQQETKPKAAVIHQGNIPTEAPGAISAKPEPKKAQAPQKQENSITDSVVRVNVSLLDKIMNVVGELVLTRNQILQFASSDDSSELQRLSNQLNTITTELQEDVMTTRMQPIGTVLTRFERIVRDMARDLGKNIDLKIEGKSTELDKTLLEAIKDPLTHMIRNSVDHGIEMPDVRAAASKPELGTLSINAYHEGGQVTIEIADDGGGISKEKLKEKAVSKGLITPEKAASLSEKETLNLIFLPGFSTAQKVTNISGRGVGMDVVRNNIEKIGGKIEITSLEGVGTTFKLKIPLTLAIIPALIVHSGASSFAIPQINLLELVRADSSGESQIEVINGAEFFRLRGDLIPIISLNRVLNLPEKEDVDLQSQNIVVLNSDGRVYGLVVDEISDTVEIVVKPLAKQLKNLQYYAGATIMGDGLVSLILDVNGIANFIHLNLDSRREEDSLEQQFSKDNQEMLLFKVYDRPNDLYTVPLVLVNRLEEFDKEKVEFTGDQAVIHYRGSAMPLYFIHKELGYAKSGFDELPSVLPVFVLALRGTYVGFVVESILDVANTIEEINDNVSDRPGVLGTLFIRDKTASVIDVFKMLENTNFGGPDFKRTMEFEQQQSQKKPEEKRRILIAEDSPMFRKMAVKLIQELGYQTFEAVDGQDAADFLAKNPEMDLIVSDIEMPHMNGWELAKHVRNSDKIKNIPMIALTTRYSKDDIEKGRQAGFNYYLEKFNKEDIQEAISKVVKMVA